MSCWQLGKAVHFQSPIVERSKQAATSIHTSESFLPLLWALTLESWEWPWALLTTRNYSAGLGEKEGRRKEQEESSRPLTNRKKQQFQAGRLSFLPSDIAHTPEQEHVWVWHILAYHGCGQTRQEQNESALVSAPHGLWWVCSCACHACARVCVKIWAVSQSSDLTASIIALFLSWCSPSTWQALVCSFSCFSLPKEKASCGTCFFSALDLPPAYLKELT